MASQKPNAGDGMDGIGPGSFSPKKSRSSVENSVNFGVWGTFHVLCVLFFCPGFLRVKMVLTNPKLTLKGALWFEDLPKSPNK